LEFSIIAKLQSSKQIAAYLAAKIINTHCISVILATAIYKAELHYKLLRNCFANTAKDLATKLFSSLTVAY
jgi:hypothetical protein